MIGASTWVGASDNGAACHNTFFTTTIGDLALCLVVEAMVRDAAALKQKGNELFKAGALSSDIQRDIEHASYTQKWENRRTAEEVDDSDPVFPSNLSAALFELGEYKGCVEAILRAWRHMQNSETTTEALVVRLSTRLAKAACHGAHAHKIQAGDPATLHPEVDKLRSAALSIVANDASQETLRNAWEEWAITETDMSDLSGKRDACLAGLSRLPMFCRALDDTKEYFGRMGGISSPSTSDQLPEDNLSEIAFLFGGVGNAHHVFGSLCGLSAAYKSLSSRKQAKFHTHMTLLDIHDATIARDLCLFMLLDELNNTNDASLRVEIKTTLMYMYCCSVMPPYCYTRLQDVFKSLSRRLASSPPDLPQWMHVSPTDIPTIRKALEFWMTATRSTRETLANHAVRPLIIRPPKTPTIAAAERARIKAALLGMSGEQVVEAGLCPRGTSPNVARKKLHKAVDVIVEQIRGCQSLEQHWTALTKVLMPPEVLWTHHPSFGPAWARLDDRGQMPASSLKKVVDHIESSWKPNITMLDRSYDDPGCHRHTDGYRAMMNDFFEVVDELQTYTDCLHAGTSSSASHRQQDESWQSLLTPKLAWKVCDAFFEDAAAALRNLEQKVTLEFLVGGLSEELAKMRWGGDGSRPKDFPRRFTRMWLSNSSDYTHCVLNLVLYVAPNLQDRPYAALASNLLLNVPAWGGDHDLLFHTYTLLTIADLPRYLPCTIINYQIIMHVLELGPIPSLPRPLSSLARRDELTIWLTRVLFNTFIPGRSESPFGGDVRLPHNLVAFFGLLMRLHEIGYPAHWLSEFLARVLSGRMVSDIAPYNDTYPIPLQESARRVPVRTVRTDPWLVEFETIIATAYYAIPFPVTSALPADFSHDPADVAEWTVPVRPRPWTASPQALGFHGVLYHPVAHLLFYRTDKVGVEDVIGHMSNVFEGRKAGPALLCADFAGARDVPRKGQVPDEQEAGREDA
ncbi:hypothetical protein C8Q80DRAFT_1124983 [Daedaleopsis nitida]|nr:hypothetical protein C8Q80DRAFT_1124983 [Daedaleopsis nitida]